jgi:hypothetical protein
MRRRECPRDPNHNRFYVHAHVEQLWIVNPTGEFVEVVKDCNTIQLPHEDAIWSCVECGAPALPVGLFKSGG